MPHRNQPSLVLRRTAHVLTGSDQDFDPVLEPAGDARFMLIGEASHGSHQFYRDRAEIPNDGLFAKLCAPASTSFHPCLPEPFDVVIHRDQTRAVEPLERSAGWEAGELPETYPFAV